MPNQPDSPRYPINDPLLQLLEMEQAYTLSDSQVAFIQAMLSEKLDDIHANADLDKELDEEFDPRDTITMIESILKKLGD